MSKTPEEYEKEIGQLRELIATERAANRRYLEEKIRLDEQIRWLKDVTTNLSLALKGALDAR
jgi:hypothetical protein